VDRDRGRGPLHTAIEVAGRFIGGVERSLVIDLEECLAILLGTPQLTPLEDDDGPRNNRKYE